MTRDNTTFSALNGCLTDMSCLLHLCLFHFRITNLLEFTFDGRCWFDILQNGWFHVKVSFIINTRHKI